MWWNPRIYDSSFKNASKQLLNFIPDYFYKILKDKFREHNLQNLTARFSSNSGSKRDYYY